ncbi:hypothetical protein M6B38_277730 [Iris pallida]|uniref:Uncharacterized protein n=1 Tax=Iris pallida TaxID=29817 RepID=A0AAX6I4G2_IRIPA|nr:hypothetical protein M6B38_277730 [Iris pallida]
MKTFSDDGRASSSLATLDRDSSLAKDLLSATTLPERRTTRRTTFPSASFSDDLSMADGSSDLDADT